MPDEAPVPPVHGRCVHGICSSPTLQCGPTTVSVYASVLVGCVAGRRKRVQFLGESQFLPVNVTSLLQTFTTRSSNDRATSKGEHRRAHRSDSRTEPNAHVDNTLKRGEYRADPNKLSLVLQATITVGAHTSVPPPFTAYSPTNGTPTTATATLSVSQQLRGTACLSLDDIRLQRQTSTSVWLTR